MGDPLPAILAGRALAADRHADLYSHVREAGSSFIYPPLAAVLARPFAHVPSVELLERVSALSFVLLVAIAVLVGKIARPRSPAGVVATVFATLAFYPIARSVELNQTSLLVTAAMGGCLLLVERERDALAGVCLAVACVVKPHLALMFLLLAWPMRRLVLAGLAACGVGLAVSVLGAGVANHVAYMTKVAPLVSSGYAFFPNQSWNGLLHRLLTDAPLNSFVIASRSWPVALGTAVGLVATLAVGASILRRPPPNGSRGLAVGLAWLLTTMASPIAWEHHYAPAIFLFAILVRDRDRFSLVDGRLTAGVAVASFALLGGYFEILWLPTWMARLLASYRLLGALGLAWLATRALRSPSRDAAPDSIERGGGLRPELRRRLELGFIVAAGCLAVYVLTQLVRFHHGRDQGIYAVVARAMLEGGRPYKDAWDFKPPGVYFVYAAARALFGSGQHAVRIVEGLALASLVIPFWSLSKRFVGDGRAGLLGASLAIVSAVELEFWHTAQPESFGGVILAYALLCAVRAIDAADDRAALPWMVGAGALYAAAGWMKPPLAFAALYPAWLLARARWRDGGVRKALVPPVALGIGVSVVSIPIVGYFVSANALGAFVDAVLRYAPKYTALSFHSRDLPGNVLHACWESVTAFSAYGVVGIAALVALPTSEPSEKAGLRHILGVTVPILLGVGLQAKFFEYHYGACLPFVGLAAGWGLWRLASLASAGWPSFVGFAVLFIALLDVRTATRGVHGSFWMRCMARDATLLEPQLRTKTEDLLYSAFDVSASRNRRIAEWLGAKTTKDERILIWGFEPVILDLADRRSMTRYIYDVPQRTPWSLVQARRELIADFDRNPPRVVIVAHGDVFPAVTGDTTDSARALASFPELLNRLVADYRVANVIENFEILVRQPDR